MQRELNYITDGADDLLIAGVDEVGRGPLIGDVVTAAVILDPARPVEGLADSKKLSEKKRQLLAAEIRDKALCWHIARATVAEIDRLNILQATLLAMQRAVMGLRLRPDKVLVDGNRLPKLPMPAEAIVKGDGRVAAISAASILAKVQRDEEMALLSREYPQYRLEKNKGYPTPEHLAAIAAHGVTPFHRKSFAPVRRALAEVR